MISELGLEDWPVPLGGVRGRGRVAVGTKPEQGLRRGWAAK